LQVLIEFSLFVLVLVTTLAARFWLERIFLLRVVHVRACMLDGVWFGGDNVVSSSTANVTVVVNASPWLLQELCYLIFNTSGASSNDVIT